MVLEDQNSADVSSPVSAVGEVRPKLYPGLIVDRTNEAGQPSVGECAAGHEGDHVILLHPTKAYWALTNETGLLVAELCNGSKTVAEIGQALADYYDEGEAADYLPDVLAFLGQLQKSNLLMGSSEAEEAPGPPQKPAPTPSTDWEYNLAFYLTEECNLRCKHCFVVEGKMPSDQLPADHVEQLIEEHTRLHPRTSITFSGGEITLHPEWRRLTEFAAKTASRTILCTNALLLTEEDADFLAATPRVQVQVSLDGADPKVHDYIRGPGTFKRTWAALELLGSRIPERTIVSCTLTRSVLADVQQLTRQIEELNLVQLRFLPLLKQRAALTHWDQIAPDPDELKRVYRWLLFERKAPEGVRTIMGAGFPGFVPDLDPEVESWCPLGRMTLINSQGEAYNCPSMNIEEYKIGDISEQSLADMQTSDRNEELRQRVLERRWALPECKVCAWRNFCQGGCTALMYMKTNDFYTTDEFCDFRRELYRLHVLKRAASPDEPRSPGACAIDGPAPLAGDIDNQ